MLRLTVSAAAWTSLITQTIYKGLLISHELQQFWSLISDLVRLITNSIYTLMKIETFWNGMVHDKL